VAKRALLITGATGNQGGAVIQALLDDRPEDWEIRALVRDPSSDRAKALQAEGVHLVRGDLDDDRSVAEAVQGAYGVFSVQGFRPQGVAAEEEQGKRLATAAARAGVGHFVYASAGGAGSNSGVPHFESKWHVEEHVRTLGLPATIVRPVMFMENLERPVPRALVMSLWKTYIPDAKQLQLIDVDDIGAFVAGVFGDPDRYIGQTVTLAGDSLTRPKAVAALKRGGRPALFSVRLPKLIVRRLPAEVTVMVAWMGKVGFDADLPALRQMSPDLTTLEQWAAHGSA